MQDVSIRPSRNLSGWITRTFLIILLLSFGAEGFSLSSDNIWTRKSKKKHKPSPQASAELAKVDESLNQGKIANEKIVLEEVSDSLDPFNITEHQQTTLTGRFKIRYTDTLASEGNSADKFDFLVRHHWTITSDETGLKVRELVGETAVVLPEQRRHQYFPIDVQQVWNGLDANNQPVPDGTYTYSCYGELIRTKIDEPKPPHDRDKDKEDDRDKNNGKPPKDDNPKDKNNDKENRNEDKNDKGNKGKKSLAFQDKDKGDDKEKVKLVGVSNTLSGAITVITIKPDTTPPQITNINPANGSILNTAKPVVSASYADPEVTQSITSGIDVSSVRFILDNQDMTVQAVITESGLSYTPPNNLLDGIHGITLDVKDKAGNLASAQWSFTTDTTPPAITTIPANNEVITNRTPTLVVIYSDAGIGVDLASIKITFNNADVTSLFGITANQATYTTTALSDGQYTLAVEVKDLFGQFSSITATFTLVTAVGQITPEQGGTVAVTYPGSPLYGSAVEIPPGAVSEIISASISEPQIAEVSPPPTGTNAAGPAVKFDVVPGAVFSQLVTVKVPYDETAVFSARRTETDVKLVKYDEVAKQWVNVPITSIDTTNNIVTAQVSSLSIFRVVISPLDSTQVSAPASIPAGQAVQATISLLDAQGNVAIFTGSVKVTISGTVGPNGTSAGPSEFIVAFNNQTEVNTPPLAFAMVSLQTVTAKDTLDPNITGSASVNVTFGSPAIFTKVNGDNQSAFTGEALTQPFITQVMDAFGNPVVGQTVKYEVIQGRGKFADPPSGRTTQTVNNTSNTTSTPVLPDVGLSQTNSISPVIPAEPADLPRPKQNGYELPYEATGTDFIVPDNPVYPNLRITSTEEIRLNVTAQESIVSLIVKPLTNTSSTTTRMCVWGLEPFWQNLPPGKPVYRYHDGQLQEKFKLDKQGRYIWNQDIHGAHHTYILAEHGTISLSGNPGEIIRLMERYGQTINDNIVIASDGIIVDGAGCTIVGAGSGYGIYSWNHSNITVTNCTVTNFSTGIAAYFGSANYFTNNTIYDNASIAIDGGGLNGTVSGNIITKNGIRLINNAGGTVVRNNQLDGGGVVVWSDSPGVNIQDNGIKNIDGTNGTVGVLAYSSNIIIERNTFDKLINGTWGYVWLYNAHNNRIVDNVFTNGKWLHSGWVHSSKIFSDYSNNNYVAGNRWENNDGGGGISLRGASDNNTVVNNYFYNNPTQGGVHLSGDHTVFTNNTMINSGYGRFEGGVEVGNNVFDGGNVFTYPNASFSASPEFHDNAFVRNAGYSLYLIDGNSVIRNNTFDSLVNGWTGYVWIASNGHTIIDNVFTNAKWLNSANAGGRISGAGNNNYIARNRWENNEGAGVALGYSSDHNTIINNYLYNNQQGSITAFNVNGPNTIFADNAIINSGGFYTNGIPFGIGGPTISGNLFDGGGVVIYSTNTTISGNTITNVNGWGLTLYSGAAAGTLVFHNNIYNITGFKVFSYNPVELSDNSEGNWWGRNNLPGFIAGTDSNAAAVVDSHPYLVQNGWAKGYQPGSNILYKSILTVNTDSNGIASSTFPFQLADIEETNVIEVSIPDSPQIPQLSFTANSVQPAHVTTALVGADRFIIGTGVANHTLSFAFTLATLTAAIGPDGSWQVTLPVSIPDGQYDYTVTVYDLSNNPVGKPFSGSFQLDTTPPVISIFPPDSAILTDRRPDINVNYSDSGSGVSLPTLQIWFNGSNVTSNFFVTNSNATWTGPTYDLSDGAYTISVSIQDAANNSAAVWSEFHVASAAGFITDATLSNRIEVTDPNNSLYGTAIDIPANAVPQYTAFGIGQVQPQQVQPLPTGWAQISPQVEFLPTNFTFSSAVTISIPYAEMIFQWVPQVEDNIKLLWYDPATSQWTPLTATVDLTNNLVQAELSSFSGYYCLAVSPLSAIRLQINDTSFPQMPEVTAGQPVTATLTVLDSFSQPALFTGPVAITFTGVVGPNGIPAVSPAQGFTIYAETNKAEFTVNFDHQTSITGTFTFGLVGWQMITATIEAYPNIITETWAMVIAGPPLLTKVSGDNQSAQGNTTLPEPFVTQVADFYGNPVSEGMAVEYKVIQGGGIFEDPPLLDQIQKIYNSSKDSVSSSSAPLPQNTPYPNDGYSLPYESTGREFTLTNNPLSPNLKLTSTEEIHLFITAVTDTVSVHIEPLATGSALTSTLTISGLSPFYPSITNTLYCYQDGRLLQELPLANASSWIQDISAKHHLYILPRKSTVYITEDTVLTQTVWDSIVIAESGITLNGNDQEIIGSGAGYGIYISALITGVTIKNCRISNFQTGIQSDWGEQHTFANNRITSAYNVSGTPPFQYFDYYGDGINLWHALTNTINNNNIQARNGIKLQYHCSNNLVTNNFLNIAQYGNGLMLDNASNNRVSANNVIGGSYGIYLTGAANLVSYNWLVANNTGLYLPGFQSAVYDNSIRANYVYYPVWAGISLSGFYVANNDVISNTVWGSTGYGIDLAGVNSNYVSYNTLTLNQRGLNMMGPTTFYNYVFRNNIFYNYGYNVYADYAAEISYNSEGNWWGHTGFAASDSNRPDVIDSYPLTEVVTIRKSAIVVSIDPSTGLASSSYPFKLANRLETCIVQAAAVSDTVFMPIAEMTPVFFYADSTGPTIPGTDHLNQDWTLDNTAKLSGKHYNINNLIIPKDATVYVETEGLEINAQSITIKGTLNADSSGVEVYQTWPSMGRGSDAFPEWSGGGGGGYGGRGGNGGIQGPFGPPPPDGGPYTPPAASGGWPFGNDIKPTDTGGNGGKGWGGSRGGLGGSKVILKADKIIVDGTITANGARGTDSAELLCAGAGGGSGGSVQLSAGVIEVNGLLQANGGTGGLSIQNASAGGGGGSGGRITLHGYHALTISRSARVNVAGGAGGGWSSPTGLGATNGQNGTIRIIQPHRGRHPANAPQDVSAQITTDSGGDTADLTSGNLNVALNLTNIAPSNGFNPNFVISYNSKAEATDFTDLSVRYPLGPKWTHSFNMSITKPYLFVPDTLCFTDGTGKTTFYSDQDGDGTYEPYKIYGDYSTLTATATGYLLMTKSRTLYTFNLNGQLTQIQDRNTNTITLSYTGNNLTEVTLPDGSRKIIIAYSPDNLISSISYLASPVINFGYTNGQLTSVYKNLSTQSPNNPMWQYQFGYKAGADLIETKTEPNGNAITYGYDADGKLSGITKSINGMNKTKSITYPPTTLDAVIQPVLITAYDGSQTKVIPDRLLDTWLEYTDPGNYTTRNTFIEAAGGTGIERRLLTARTMPNNGTTTFWYDIMRGNVISTTDAGLCNTQYFYQDPANPDRATSILNPNGAVTVMAYDSKGNLLSRTEASGTDIAQTTGWSYYGNGKVMTETRDPGGLNLTTGYGYDANGYLTSKVVDPIAYNLAGLNISYIFEYDALGQLRKAYDPRYSDGSVYTAYGYDEMGNRTSVSAPTRGGGRALTTFDYDLTGNLIQRTDDSDGLNIKTSYSYDNLGRLLLTTLDPLGLDIRTQNEYDDAGRLTQSTDPEGAQTLYSYYANGWLKETKRQLDSSLYALSQYFYDANGNRTHISDPESHITQYMYNLKDQLVLTQDAEGHTTSYSYDDCGCCSASSVMDARGNTTVTTHDALRRVKYVRTPQDNITTAYKYDAAGRTTQVIGPWYDANQNGATDDTDLADIRYSTYDNAGRLKTTWVNSHPPTQYEYDKSGNQTRITDAVSHITESQYDEGNRLSLTILDPGGLDEKVYYEYDNLGRQTIVTRAYGTVDTLSSYSEYDRANRLVKQYTGSMLYATNYTYNKRGQQTRITDAESHITQYFYDQGGRLTRTTDARGYHTDYDYDKDGNRIGVTYYRGGNPVNTGYSYYRNHLLKETDYPGYNDVRNKTTNTYDGNGNLVSKKDAKNQTITYTYDNNNRLITKTYPSVESVAYTYDASSNVLTTIDPNTNITNEYDDLGRLTKVTNNKFAPAKVITYQYNEDGTRKQMTLPDPANTVVNYTYDKAKRLRLVGVRGPDIGPLGAIYTYNALGLRTKLERTGGSYTTYEYDPVTKWLTKVSNYGSAGLVSEFNYTTFDNIGNRKMMQLTNTDSTSGAVYSDTVNYAFDAIYQLTNEDRIGNSGIAYTTNWQYDEVGNRIIQMKTRNSVTETTNYTYNDANQLLSEIRGTAETDYEYDANGNRIVKTSASSISNYGYDWENKQISYKDSARSKDFTYTFDALERRIAKQDNVVGTSEHYLYDDNSIVAEYDGAGVLKALYVTPFANENILMVRFSTPTSHYPMADGSGSVTNIVDANGNLESTYEYDSFGNRLFKDTDPHTTGNWTTCPTGAETHGNIVCHQNPNGFGGMRYDMESKTYNTSTGQYDSTTGRSLNGTQDNVQIPLPGTPSAGGTIHATESQMSLSAIKPALQESKIAPTTFRYKITEKWLPLIGTVSVYRSACECPEFVDIIKNGRDSGDCPLTNVNFSYFPYTLIWHPTGCSCYYAYEWTSPYNLKYIIDITITGKFSQEEIKVR